MFCKGERSHGGCDDEEEGLCVRNEGASTYVMVRGVVYVSMRACEKDKG